MNKKQIMLLIPVILALLSLGGRGVKMNPGGVVRGNLDEVVPKAHFGSIGLIELALSSTPPPSFMPVELPHCPSKLLYGEMSLGNSGGRIPVVVCEARERRPHIWLDADRDGKLEGGHPHWQGGWQEFGWLFIVLVDYIEGGQHYKASYPVWISAGPALERGPGEPFYSYSLLPGGYRKGSIELGGERMTIAVFDLNVDGRYDDVGNLGVVIDADLDGKLCFYCSHEAFGTLSPFPGDPLRVGEKAYALTQASPSGEWIELQELEGEFPKIPPPLPGHPFPELRGRTLWGEDFALADLRGQVVALFFLPQTFCTEHRPSRAHEYGLWAICSRPVEAAKLAVTLTDPKKIRVVVVLTEEEPPSLQEWEELKFLNVPVLWCPWVPKDYRILHGFFLIDPEGLIGHTDEAVSIFRDEFAHRMLFEPEFADIPHILWAIEKLLEEGGDRALGEPPG